MSTHCRNKSIAMQIVFVLVAIAVITECYNFQYFNMYVGMREFTRLTNSFLG